MLGLLRSSPVSARIGVTLMRSISSIPSRGWKSASRNPITNGVLLRSALVRRIAFPVFLTVVAGGCTTAMAEEITPPTPSGAPEDFGQDKVKKSVEDSAPFAGAISFGTISGFCSGYALAKLGKGVVVVAGIVFMGFQSAAYGGYVTVNWAKVEHDIMKQLDVNDDGVVDSRDAKVVMTKLFIILTSNMAGAVAGFTGGFLYGARKGWK
eukprot:CFRG4919T1